MSSIRLLFFGRLAPVGAVAGDSLEIESGKDTPQTIRTRMESLHPQVREMLRQPQVKVAINKKIAAWDSPLFEGDELAFLPPVTGG